MSCAQGMTIAALVLTACLLQTPVVRATSGYLRYDDYGGKPLTVS